ncbi:MAG: prolipoprotein diacylglyceryl transferase [Myxococcales bacterium]|nr:prolipoprotein diacylglyceryl transferase [Myxococcales bacterium]
MVVDIPHLGTYTVKAFGLAVPIQPFGILVGTGLVVGYLLGRRRADKMGLDPDICADGMVWTVVVGFILAHLVSVIFYFPERVAQNPLVLLAFWSGISSFGGFIGGALGAFLYFRKQKVPLLYYAEAIIFGLMPGWIFGRMGCTIVKDHPGLPTDFFLGVLYPGGVVRHDLGFYELIYTVFLTAVIYAVKNVRPFWGFHCGLMLILYAPVRFGFDFLRTADKKYLGLTPGQYLAIALFLGGFALWGYGMKLKKKGDSPATFKPVERKRDQAPEPKADAKAKNKKKK